MRVRRGRLRALIIPVLAGCLGVAVVIGASGSTTPSGGGGPVAAAAAAGKTAPSVAPAADTGAAAPPVKPPTAFSVPTGCNVAEPGMTAVRCDSVLKADSTLRPLSSASGPVSGSLGPADIHAAYELPDSGGAGETVAVIDALGDSHAEADLGVYRAQYGLPPCTTDNGCFRKIDQNGGSDYPADDPGWAQETTLDLDAVSAVCPDCHILLVEAASTSPYDIVVGVDTAVRLGAKFVSNSYGIDGEDPAQDTLDQHYDTPGVAMVASTGDHGYANQDWPAANPHVVAAGGTSLYRDAGNPRGWSEQAWAAAGSGCSLYEAKPDYQQALATGCANRALADISAVADPASGFAIYDSGAGGWGQAGGTSLSSPLIAAMYALAGGPKPGTYPVTYPYFNQGNDLNDVTAGTNGTCGNVLCSAGAGWDGPTGLGSPQGLGTLTYTPQGTLAGHVRDASGAPVAGAAVTATGKNAGHVYHTTTDAQGAYRLAIAEDSYTVGVSRFGYRPGEQTLSIVDDQQLTADFALTRLATQTVSGTVTDGSGHGWPLYAKITIDGYPDGAVFTDPFTGRYSVDLPQNADYQLHVSPVHPGYRPVDQEVTVAAAAVRQDFEPSVDTAACAAPGYAHGLLTHFDGWLGTAPRDGWTIGNADPASTGWTFDDGTEIWNLISTGDFAVASPYSRGGEPEDTTLTTPVTDLTKDPAPALSFAAVYLPDTGTTFDAELSLDGGRTWQQVWHQDTQVVQTVVSLPLPQAAGQPSVRVRFHYTGRGASLAELDDVSIGSCVPVPGGLVAGVVTDGNTGQPANGATVADSVAASRSAVTGPTPDDPALPDGFYTLFDTPGAHGYTVTWPRYAGPPVTVTTAVNSVARKDIVLGAGRLEVGSAGLSATETLGRPATRTVQLTNTGTAPLGVSVEEHTSGFTPVDAAAAGWQSLGLVPEFLYENAVAGYQGKIYSMGGMPMHQLVPVARSYVYDPVAQQWTPIAPMPEPVMRGVAAVLNGTVYVVGGINLQGPSAAVYAYHPQNDTWSRVADLPAPVIGTTAATLDGKLYAVGGCATRCGTDPVSTVYSYDPADDAWTELADYPQLESEAACAGVHDELVCAGGLTAGGGNLSAAYAFRPDPGEWTRVADMPYSDSQMVYSGANGRLQVAGGYTGGGKVPTGETARSSEYDPVADVWSPLPDAPVAFYGAGRGACALYQMGSFVPPLRTAALLPGYDQCGDDDTAWLSENQTRIELAPGASEKVTVTLDSAKVTQPGGYAATLVFDTDTPYADQSMPVTLQVTPPKTWGELTGTVTDAGSGAALAGATVQICTMYHNGVCGEVAYTLKTDAQGHYRLWLDKGYDPLFVTVAEDGYQPRFQQVRVRKGERTVADVALPAI